MEVNEYVPPFLHTTGIFMDALRDSRGIFNSALRDLSHRNEVPTMALTTSMDTLRQAHTNLMQASRNATVVIRVMIEGRLACLGTSPLVDEVSDEPPTELGSGMQSLVSILIRDLEEYRRVVQVAAGYLDHIETAPEAVSTEVLQSQLHRLNQAYELFLEVSGHLMPFIIQFMRNPKLSSPREYAATMLGEAEPDEEHAGAGPEEVGQGVAAPQEPVKAENGKHAGTGLGGEPGQDVVVPQEPVQQAGVHGEAVLGGEAEHDAPQETGEQNRDLPDTGPNKRS